MCSFQAPNGLDPVYVNPALMRTFKHTGRPEKNSSVVGLAWFRAKARD
jgi:hypothetical protein